MRFELDSDGIERVANSNKYARNINSNEFDSDRIELTANSNKYARNIGSNEFVSDGIELTANSNKYARNISSNELGSDGIERITSWARNISILIRNSEIIKIGQNECNNDLGWIKD